MCLITRPILVFDLDDTLYLEQDYILSGFAHVSRWLGDRPAFRDFEERCRHKFQQGERHNVFGIVLRELNIDPHPRLVQQLVHELRRHSPQIKLASDTVRLLRRLPPDAQTAVITDGRLSTQLAKVAALKLHRHIAKIICTDTWGHAFWKPHPRAFAEVEAHFSVEGNQCVYFGDNPSKDFVTARQRGWQTVRVRRIGGLHTSQVAVPSHRAHRQIQSFDELELQLDGATTHTQKRSRAA